MANRIPVGTICALDKDNKVFHISGDQMTYVKIMSDNNALFSVKYCCKLCDRDGNITNDNHLWLGPEVLTPLNQLQVVVLRYPKDTPIVNKEEVKCLKKVLFNPDRDTIEPSDIKTVGKLLIKLELFSEITHEY